MKKSLGDRMKGYENVNRTYLMRRTPVIIRLDGKAFHTYTKGCDKPFDEQLHQVRSATLKYLCENIQGVILGYSQSDEISLILKDWNNFNTSAWFDNNLQKLVSVSAGMCTMKWNKLAGYMYEHELGVLQNDAIFDSRAFNLPKEEVVNYFVWRQQDWERNSVQMLARSFYSQKECFKLSCPELITKVENEKGVVWGNLDNWKKQGEIWFNGEIVSRPFIFKNERLLIQQILDSVEE